MASLPPMFDLFMCILREIIILTIIVTN